MIYSEFKGMKLSALGMGGMRFPTKNDGKDIDMMATRELIAYSIKNGINYFDTAWAYHGGQSEECLGEILSEYPRESYYLASKFPGYDLSTISRVKEIFEEQIKRCRVDYFDFYLFHNVSEHNVEQYLDPKYGIYDYLIEQKRNGRIKHLGFSTHGSLETIERFLKAYGGDMEFCQIQLNWFDWHFQNAGVKVELLKKWNIPIWVMEPVRGGRLCSLEEKYLQRLNALAPGRSLPEWAFRFVQSVPEVKVILSGMSSFEMLKENIKTFEEQKPLTDEEFNTLIHIAKEETASGTLPCTSCRYCIEHCPQGINIPWLIEIYNGNIYSKREFTEPLAFKNLADEKKPSGCLSCKACEAVCPQNIKISEMMRDFAERLKK
jgi:predicted aldo/keto reductase-like oxidoreductase